MADNQDRQKKNIDNLDRQKKIWTITAGKINIDIHGRQKIIDNHGRQKKMLRT